MCSSATFLTVDPLQCCVCMQYKMYCQRCALWCTACAFYASVGYTWCLGCSSVFANTSSLQNHTVLRDFETLAVSLLNDLDEVRWSGTGLFKSSVNMLLCWPEQLSPFLSSIIIIFVFLPSVCWVCGIGIFLLIGCISNVSQPSNAHVYK